MRLPLLGVPFLVACSQPAPQSTVTCGEGTELRGAVCVVRDAGAAYVDPPRDASADGPSVPEPARGLAYQLTHGATYDPSFSPDGRRMVYITVVAGKEQLFLADADASHPVQLTTDAVDHEDPAWSPAGDRIAYVRVDDKKAVIHWMRIDGTADEALTTPDVRVIHPSFSPDGKTLAYCTDDDLKPPKKNASDIVFLDLASRRSRVVVTGGVNTYPAISPDGRKLAFRRMVGETNSEVFVADIDGKNATNITKSPAFDGWPRWSPDGRWIAFATNARANHQVYVMRPDGGDVRKVAPTEGRATAPVWSPDGRLIYFPNCFKVDFGYDCQIFVARAPID